MLISCCSTFARWTFISSQAFAMTDTSCGLSTFLRCRLIPVEGCSTALFLFRSSFTGNVGLTRGCWFWSMRLDQSIVAWRGLIKNFDRTDNQLFLRACHLRSSIVIYRRLICGQSCLQGDRICSCCLQLGLSLRLTLLQGSYSIQLVLVNVRLCSCLCRM